MKNLTVTCLLGYTWSTELWPSWDEMVSHGPLTSGPPGWLGGAGWLGAWGGGTAGRGPDALSGDVETGPDPLLCVPPGQVQGGSK